MSTERKTRKELLAEIERLEADVRMLHDVRRWHFVKTEGKDLIICCGDHHRSQGCEFYRYRYVGPA